MGGGLYPRGAGGDRLISEGAYNRKKKTVLKLSSYNCVDRKKVFYLFGITKTLKHGHDEKNSIQGKPPRLLTGGCSRLQMDEPITGTALKWRFTLIHKRNGLHVHCRP